MEKLEKCPACLSGNIKFFDDVEDHSVSQERFQIWNCAACSCRFTNPRPTSADIGRYYESEDYISHSDTQKGFINSLYQLARNYTLKQKLRLVTTLDEQNEKTILDIGCGTGHFLETCKNAGWKVNGTEPDNGARKLAEQKLQVNIIKNLLETDLAKKYQIVSMWHVLEHIHKLDESLAKAKKLLSNNGSLVIAVPNYKSLDAQHYDMNWAAYDVPRHLYHFSPQSMNKLLDRHNFKITQQKGMYLDSFYVSMLSEKYKQGYLPPISGAIQGLLSNLSAVTSGNYSSIIYIAKQA